MKKKYLIILTVIVIIIISLVLAIKKTIIKKDYWPTLDWKTATPQSKGIDEQQLEKMDKYVQKSLPHIYSILIVKDGYLVYEKYYQNYDSNQLFLVCSVTKTFTSALIGIAVKEGYLKSIDQKIYKFFPEYMTDQTPPGIKDVTIKHLLTMTSGLAGNEFMLFRPEVQNDMIKYVFSHPMQGKPGGSFYYNTLGSQVLSGIIKKTTKMNALEFANKHLFGPLGIKEREWDMDAKGNNFGGMQIHMRSRDLAKFGYLLLNKGFWDGKQVIPAQWVEQMTTKHNNGGMPEASSYGLHCWVVNRKEHPAFFASGFGGQFVYVVPDLDTVVVITSSLGVHMANKSIVSRFIIPAMK